MAWTREQLRDWVKARVDELSSVSQTDIVQSTTILQELDEAALHILRKAKVQLVYPAGISHEVDSLVTLKPVPLVATPVPHSVIIPVDADFLRLLRVKVNGWDIACDDLIATNTTLFRQLFNPPSFATPDKPTCALVPFYWVKTSASAGPTPTVEVKYTQAIQAFPAPVDLTGYEEVGDANGGSANGLKYYKNASLSTGKKAMVSEVIIVKKSPAEKMPDSLVDPMVWLAAGRCLTLLKDKANAEAAYANYAASLNGLMVGLKGEDVPMEKRK